MESLSFLGLLAPVAFVFALSASGQAGKLQKEIQELREEVQRLSAILQEKQ